MLLHIEDDFFPFILVAAAVEERELLLVFGFGYAVEGYLVEVFEEPRAVGGVVLFGAEDVDTRDGHAGHLVATGGVDVVQPFVPLDIDPALGEKGEGGGLTPYNCHPTKPTQQAYTPD